MTKWIWILGVLLAIGCNGTPANSNNGESSHNQEVTKPGTPTTAPVENCTPTPSQLAKDGHPGWVSGPVTMRQPLGWVATQPFKVVWFVPDEWTDGITVRFSHLSKNVPEYTEQLTQIKRSGAGISFGMNYALEVPGCWRITVTHGQEHIAFTVLVSESVK